MTNNIQRIRKFVWSATMLLAVIGIAGLTQAGEAKHGKDTMKQADMTLWQAIDALAQQIPFSRKKVETLLSTHLEEKSGTTSWNFFEGPGPKLSEGAIISNIDLRLRLNSEGQGFLVLEIGGACVTIDQIKAHYENLRITGSPRGGSLNAQTYYSKTLPWGELSFGIKEENPRCLFSVIFRPTGS